MARDQDLRCKWLVLDLNLLQPLVCLLVQMRVLRLPAGLELVSGVMIKKDVFPYFELELIVKGCDMFIQFHVDIDIHQIGVLRRRHVGLHCESHGCAR